MSDRSLTKDIAVDDVGLNAETCSEVVKVDSPRVERPHQSTGVINVHTDDIAHAIVTDDCVGVALANE